MKQLPISVLARRFDNSGRRIWYMAQGKDPLQIETEVASPKSIGHGKVVPPNCKDIEQLHTFLLHMSEKVATRLRRYELEATRFYIGLRSAEGWIGGKLSSPLPTDDGRQIMALCYQVLQSYN